MISPIFLTLCSWLLVSTQPLFGELTRIHFLSNKPVPSSVARTGAEVQFIGMDYGVVYEPRKLGRKERLALRFSRMTDEL